MTRRPAVPAAVITAYRIALRLYPREFRSRFGDDLVESFRSACRRGRRRRGGFGLLAAAGRGLVDAARSGLAERLRPYDGRRDGPSSTSATLPESDHGAPMEALLYDLRFAARGLLDRPLFTAVAVVTLALGIGANTAVFGVVNALLLRPLPVERPDELLEVYTIDADSPEIAGPSSYPDYLDLQARADRLEALVGHSLAFARWQRQGVTRLIGGEVVTGNYFDELGVELALGRGFLPEEGRTPETHPVAVISWRMWQRQLGGEPGVLQQRIRLNGVPFDIVGVSERGFTGLTPGLAAEVFVPAMMSETIAPAGIQSVEPSPTGDVRVEQRANRWMLLKARPRPGATIEQVRAELESIVAALAREHPQTNEGATVRVVPASDVRIHPLVDGALSFAGAAALGMVGLVLLIACANIANMLLARASTRRQEIAVRLALGSGRGRLVRQLLTESLLLAAVGAALGLLLAWWVVRLLAGYQPPLPVPVNLALGIDLRVFGFTAMITFLAAVVFGLVPALQASRPDLVEALKDGRRGSSDAGSRRLSLRNLLVIAQVALCTVLLVAAALLLRGLDRAGRIDLGFDPQRLAVLSLDPRMHGYEDAEEIRAFGSMLAERLRREPQAVSVALATRAPLSLSFNQNAVYFPDRGDDPDDPPELVPVVGVGPGYFGTMGLEILRGRGIEPTDTGDAATVAVVTAATERRFWPGESAVDKTFRVGGLDGDEVRVVGVVQDYKVQTVGESPRPYVHFSGRQRGSGLATLVVRTAGPASAAMPALRVALREIEPDLALIEDAPLSRLVDAALFPARAATALLGGFSLLALLLAAVGLYGVVAYAVSQRTREIGIRIAVGADSVAVLRQVLAHGLGLAAVGLLIGFACSALLGGILSQWLYGVSGLDPLALLSAGVVMFGVTALANLVPARRAARLDPTTAIRAE